MALKDADGEPVPDAELAVIVVDEAILALTNYQLTDPISVFYTERPSDVWSVYSRASIILANPHGVCRGATPQATAHHDRQLWAGWGRKANRGGRSDGNAYAQPLPMADMAKADDDAGPAQTPITVRSNFNPLATFAPEVRTDANGEASVRVKLPDNLTRYRVMVVAVDDGGNQFGSGGSQPDRAPAPDGAPVRAALPELWRQLRTAGRAAKPDR